MSKYGAIYSISFKGCDRLYIGSTVDYRRRHSQHLYLLRLNKHTNPKLQNYFNKYGENNFRYEIIEYLKDYNPEQIREIEQHYLDRYFAKEYINSNRKDNRFDLLTLNVSPDVGKEIHFWSEERRENQREANRKRIWTKESIEKMVLKKKGKPLSVEQKNKIRKSIKLIRSKNKVLKNCPYCTSLDTNRVGFRTNKTLNITYQRFKCNNCKKSFK